MKPGIVFKWENFPEPKFNNKIKARWFVYLGESPSFLTPHFAYIHTTTAQTDEFEIGGRRHAHQYIKFDCSKTPFEEDCILDFDEGCYPFLKERLERNPDIQIKGELDDITLKRIYNGIRQSDFYSLKDLQNIHNSLNMAGITGLKKPK
ncbi:MAG: hypothetical protein COZ68_05015 [Deltaproteobacteria bacterium CG_4_8_14_3_um_filter_43_13]|nr:MAG: hypothetical protein AUK23_02300 [Deltaproteobacteria bacterium CG2_30_43_15]PIU84557.1 MAG: hypothetical protein COS67_12680 [Deltaproteobacteria bacterium CG06_land_8_20_14_3_00_44_19]PIX24979.1 MAG: hypothetical protein COZ68_05015 [Deltaproteobacteria bacterium CG_4_8_14_3_um_filter_43_13]